MANLSIKQLLLVILSSMAIGASIAYTLTSSNVTTTETQVKERDRIVTIIVEAKDGSKKTTIVQDKKRVSAEKSVIKASVPKRNTINISALYSVDTTDRFRPAYGLSVSKEVLGPITIGIFGLTDGTIGVSIGGNF